MVRITRTYTSEEEAQINRLMETASAYGIVSEPIGSTGYRGPAGSDFYGSSLVDLIEEYTSFTYPPVRGFHPKLKSTFNNL